MCVSAYDLVCDKCRSEHDRIFAPLTEKRDYTKEEETKARQEWYSHLCKDCDAMLKEEGFIVDDEQQRQRNELWEIARKTRVEYDRVSDHSARVGYFRTYVSCPNCHDSYLEMEVTGSRTGATELLSCKKCGWSDEQRAGSHAWSREEYEEQYQEALHMGGPAYARQWEDTL